MLCLFVCRSLIIVVTPLIAIMEDQVSTFSSRGVKAACVFKGSGDAALNRAIEDGQYKLNMFSPEILFTKKWRQVLLTDVWQKNIVGFIVDEAHCVQKWYNNSIIIVTIIIL